MTRKRDRLRRYQVRDDKQHWLADIVIADDGYFSTVSDYGNYAYWGWSFEEDFRQFLIGLEAGYLLRKIAVQEYDGPATLQAVKSYILQSRREGSLSPREARSEWNLLAECNGLAEREDFAFWWRDTTIEDPTEFAMRTHPDDAKSFAVRVWPRFVEMLRAELAEERAKPHGPST